MFRLLTGVAVVAAVATGLVKRHRRQQEQQKLEYDGVAPPQAQPASTNRAASSAGDLVGTTGLN